MATEPRTYMIPVGLADSFRARFDRIVARAEKLGVEAPTYRIVDERNVLIDDYRRIPALLIQVDGEAPRYDGWTPLAVIEIDHLNPDTPNLVHPIGDATTDPAWRTRDAACDHCATNRRRNRIVAVEHTDGARKIVGMSCLRDFLGHQSPDQIAGYVEALAFLDFSDLDLAGDRYAGGAPIEWDPTSYLAAVFAEIETNGWVARSHDGNPTADVVAKAMNDGKATWTDAHVADAETAIAWAANLEPSNDYLANLSAVAAKETWTDRHLGLAASMAPAYRRATAEADTPETPSEHFGTIGDRVTFPATVTRVHRMPGYAYRSPDRAVVTMATADGNIAVWFASNADRAPQTGDKIEVTGTVKTHDEYRGTAQTIVTRCKWTPARCNA